MNLETQLLRECSNTISRLKSSQKSSSSKALLCKILKLKQKWGGRKKKQSCRPHLLIGHLINFVPETRSIKITPLNYCVQTNWNPSFFVFCFFLSLRLNVFPVVFLLFRCQESSLLNQWCLINCFRSPAPGK